MLTKNKATGFVLIEMIIYVALFSLLLGGLVVTAYQLFESTSDTTAKVGTQEEINFVLKKLDWAFTGAEASSIDISPSSEITLDKFGESGSITIRKTGNKIEMKIGSGPYEPLTSANVVVEDLDFTFSPSTDLVSATFTIDGMTASISKLLKI